MMMMMIMMMMMMMMMMADYNKTLVKKNRIVQNSSRQLELQPTLDYHIYNNHLTVSLTHLFQTDITLIF